MNVAIDQTSAEFQEAKEILRRSKRIVGFTGAGISAESGIPTFRGEGGLWSNIDIDLFGTPHGIQHLIRTDPVRLVQYLDQRARTMFEASPNPAHQTLADLEKNGRCLGVVTQNVDDLHGAGGSKRIYKLHGDLVTWVCLKCRHRHPFGADRILALIDTIQQVTTPNELLALLPTCDFCDGYVRPSVVLFTEMLPQAEIAGATDILSQTDCLLIIGTSGAVEPAASFARDVARRGVPTIELNMEPSELTHYATVSLFGPAGKLLPALVE